VLLAAISACSGDGSTPTDVRPQFDGGGCTNSATIGASPKFVTVARNATGTATYTITNTCPSTPSTWAFIMTRTGAVASVGNPSPVGVTLAGGASAVVTVPFTAGSTAGSGTVRIQAYADLPAANIFATTFVTVSP
jgi:hypothetical protein